MRRKGIFFFSPTTSRLVVARNSMRFSRRRNPYRNIGNSWRNTSLFSLLKFHLFKKKKKSKNTDTGNIHITCYLMKEVVSSFEYIMLNSNYRWRRQDIGKEFDVLLTVHLSINLVNDQLEAQFSYFILFYNTLITVLYTFRATSCSSSGGQIVLIQHLVSSLSVSGRPKGRPLTESDDTRCCINTIWPPDDEHDVARNM